MSQKETYPLSQTFIGAFDLTWGDQIRTIIHIDPQVNRLAFPEVKEPGRVNGFVEKFLTFADVPNIPYTDPPPVPVETSRSEAYAIQKQVEWHSPGFGILIWKTKKANPSSDPLSDDWVCIGYHSVINTGVWRQYDSFPVLSGNNLADKLAEGDRVGVSLESRWVNGIEYFPRLAAPFSLPDNRPDRITFDVGWVQELVVSTKTPQPIIMYVTNYANGTTEPPVVQKQPVVSLNINTVPINSTLYDFEKTAFTADISDLSPGVDYTYQWLFLGNPIGEPVVGRSEANGTKSLPFTSNQFRSSPFSGTGNYSLRVTQGNLSTDSNAIAVRCFSCAIRGTFINTNTTSGWTADVFDFKDGIPVTITMMKNGVDLTDWSLNATPVYYVGINPPRHNVINIPVTMWANASWGTSTTAIYQFKVTYNDLSIVSPAFAAYPFSSGGGKG